MQTFWWTHRNEWENFTFLRTDIEFLVKGKVSIFMKYYIEESTALIYEDLDSIISSPEESSIEYKWKFTKTGQTRGRHPALHSSKNAAGRKQWRPNIEPAMSLLCTRVNKINVEDKLKLKHELQFLKPKINNKIVMGKYNLCWICTWTNDAYGVHPDLKS